MPLHEEKVNYKEDLLNRIDIWDAHYGVIGTVMHLVDHDDVLQDLPYDKVYFLHCLQLVREQLRHKSAIAQRELDHIDNRWRNQYVEI